MGVWKVPPSLFLVSIVGEIEVINYYVLLRSVDLTFKKAYRLIIVPIVKQNLRDFLNNVHMYEYEIFHTNDQ